MRSGFSDTRTGAGSVSVLFSDLRNETPKGGDWITLVLNGPYVMTIPVLKVQSILVVLATTLYRMRYRLRPILS